MRPAGTLVMESLNVTAETYLDIHIKENGVLDMIKHKMSWLKEDEIRIRHDGAPGHTGHGNAQFLFQAGQADGWNIIYETQPSQSPDLNKNDLCFFNSLQTQAEKLKEESQSKEVLLQAVIDEYNAYDPMILNRFDALQYEVYREILKDGGNNQYKMPHSGIRERQRNGLEVVDRRVSAIDLNFARAKLLELRNLL